MSENGLSAAERSGPTLGRPIANAGEQLLRVGDKRLIACVVVWYEVCYEHNMLSAAAVLVCGLELLGRSSTRVPVHFLATPPVGVSRNAEAFVQRDPVAIVLITSSPAFREAQRRPSLTESSRAACLKIASVIVHEEWHLSHGSDESGAYVAQIVALMAMGADSATVTAVRRSMAAALSQRPINRDFVVATR